MTTTLLILCTHLTNFSLAWVGTQLLISSTFFPCLAERLFLPFLTYFKKSEIWYTYGKFCNPWANQDFQVEHCLLFQNYLTECLFFNFRWKMSSVKFPAWVKRRHSREVLPPMSGGKLRFVWYLFYSNYFPGVALSSVSHQSKVSRPFQVVLSLFMKSRLHACSVVKVGAQLYANKTNIHVTTIITQF